MKIKNMLVGCGCGLPVLFVLTLVVTYFISGYIDQSRHKEQIIGTYVFDTIRQDQDFFFDEELSHQKIEDYKGVIIKFKPDFTYVINKKVPYFYGNTHGKWKVGWKKDFDCMLFLTFLQLINAIRQPLRQAPGIPLLLAANDSCLPIPAKFTLYQPAVTKGTKGHILATGKRGRYGHLTTFRRWVMCISCQRLTQCHTPAPQRVSESCES